jgi:pimeloyl-ACP methyl ester carboxylesterase
LPGLTRNSLDFALLAQLLADDRRVICPDLRGRGASEYDPNWRNYNPARYCKDVWDLLDASDIESVVVIGTSLGGIMAMMMGHQQPTRVRAVVMNDIGPEMNPAGIARVVAGAGRLDTVDTFAQAVTQVKSIYEIAFPDWNDEQWNYYTEITYCETETGRYDLNFDRNIGRAAREGVSGLAEDPWTLYDSLGDTPALVVHGAISDILTTEIIDKMRARKPDLEVATVRNRGHAPLLDEQEAVDAISTFIASV